MAKLRESSELGRERRDLKMAVALFLLSVVVLYLPQGLQDQVSATLTNTVLRPFYLTQQALTLAKDRSGNVRDLQAQLDSLAAIVASQASVVEENRRLRESLGLRERGGDTFLPASLIRPGTAGSESMFLLDVGLDQGISRGDPVVSRGGRLGLVGVVHQVRWGASIGLDWSHPDFRASGMTEDGEISGIVLSERGDFREEDRLRLDGTPYYEVIARGTLVTTSGLGGVFPRGIPVGWIDVLADSVAGWRKDYWLRPVVEVGSATHVLVVLGDTLLEGAMELFREGEPAARGWTLPGDSVPGLIPDRGDRGP